LHICGILIIENFLTSFDKCIGSDRYFMYRKRSAGTDVSHLYSEMNVGFKLLFSGCPNIHWNRWTQSKNATSCGNDWV